MRANLAAALGGIPLCTRLIVGALAAADLSRGRGGCHGSQARLLQPAEGAIMSCDGEWHNKDLPGSCPGG